MVDTLEIAKRLESAGFAHAQAAVVAAILAGASLRAPRQFDEIRVAKVEGRFEDLAYGQEVEARIARARVQIMLWTIGAMIVLITFHLTI